MERNFKFGFWNYIESGEFTVDAVAQWKDLRCNLPMSFTYDYKKHKKEDMLAVLDACESFGMKLIIRDMRTEFRAYQKLGETEFKKGVLSAYQDFGKHPATFGFFVGDEPAPSENDDYIQTVKIVMEVMPNLIPFANLVPYFGGGSDYDTLVGASEQKHYALIDELLSKTKIPLLCYDQYSQCLNENLNVECGINSYYLVLDKYREITKKYGIPLYISLLACGHWDFRAPSEDDIRWQIYTSIAHGVKGIIWFHLYGYDAGNSYIQNPIIGKERLTTPTYDYIKRQQYIFDSYYREIIDKIYLTDVFHVGHIYDPNKRFCEDEYILDVNGKYSYPIIISYYKEHQTGEKWISFVNASQKFSNRITVTLKNGNKKVFWLAVGEMKIEKLSEFIK